MFAVIYLFNLPLQNILEPICLITAWAVLGMLVLNIWIFIKDGINTSKKMYEIPCPKCQFFTGDYHLKCTVRPLSALTEDAINCADYWPEKTHL